MTARGFRQNAHTAAHPWSQELGNRAVPGVSGRQQPFRILCAVDASPPAAAAFEQALALSAHRGAQLVVVHAVSKDARYSWRAVERVAALAALRKRAEALSVPVRVRVQQGDTADIILLHARAQAPDLIVLGSHEPVGLSRVRFRSISDRVVKAASCPVLLVPATMTRVTPAFRRVVWAIDLSSRSPGMITNVSSVVEDSANVAFLYVLRDPGRRPFGRSVVPASSNPKALNAGQQLHSLVDTHHSGSEAVISVSSKGIDDEILRVASEREADLIILGATRHTGLRRRFLGSTALKVSRRSPVPVLVLPAVYVKRELSALDEAVLGWAA
jgi:nucleotide-binding universal stress UspA family protein